MIAAPSIMLSSGGLTTVKAVKASPVRLIGSGPAAGAMVAALGGRAIEEDHLISFDMGGGTAEMYLADPAEEPA